MGLRFRKSASIGPVRLNASKSGLGWSIGGPGARYTKMANGRDRFTASIPGTGISYVKETSKKTNCVPTAPKDTTDPENLTGWAYFWYFLKTALKVLGFMALIALGICLIVFLPVIIGIVASAKR